MKLLDYYSEFRRTFHTCKHCGWHGKGTDFNNGTFNCLGINKLCPSCGEQHTLARFDQLVEDHYPDDWPPVG